jgi:hypothetical protein
LQALQFLQCVSEGRECARRTFGILRALRLAFELQTHGFDSVEFFLNGADKAFDHGGDMRKSGQPSCHGKPGIILRRWLEWSGILTLWLRLFVRLTADDGRDFFQFFRFRQQLDRRQQTPRWRHIALPAFPQRQAAQRVSVNAEISRDIGARLIGAFIAIAAVCQQFGCERDRNADGPACVRRFFGAGRRRW